jgi:hypothetical protein
MSRLFLLSRYRRGRRYGASAIAAEVSDARLSPLVTPGAITALAGVLVALAVFAWWVDPIESADQGPALDAGR